MEWKTLIERQKTGKFAADEQTGNTFELETEAIWDIIAAIISVVYLIAMLALFAWQLVDICSGRLVLLKGMLGEHAQQLNSGISRILAYAVIGGGLGGIVNGFRSILSWHAERRAFVVPKSRSPLGSRKNISPNPATISKIGGIIHL